MDSNSEFVQFWTWNNGFRCFGWWESLPCVKRAIAEGIKKFGSEEFMFDGRHEAAVNELWQANRLEF